ncbi:MAG: Flagellar hook-length control protein FliK [Planctomycetota bacterium]
MEPSADTAVGHPSFELLVSVGAQASALPQTDEQATELPGEPGAGLGAVPSVPIVPLLTLPSTVPTPEASALQGAALGLDSGAALAEAIELAAEPGAGLPNMDPQSESGLRGMELSVTRPAAARDVPEAKPQAAAPERPHLPMPREERAADILQQLRINLNASTRSAVIQLSPPELGLVTVQIKMEEDKLRTLVRAERPETLEALARHLPELRNTLQQQGLQTNDIQLELGLGNRDQAREESFAQASRRRPRGESLAGITAGEEALLARILAPRTDGVDLYA